MLRSWLLHVELIMCVVGGMIDCWTVEMIMGNEVCEFRAFVGAEKLWVYPELHAPLGGTLLAARRQRRKNCICVVISCNCGSRILLTRINDECGCGDYLDRGLGW